MRVSNSGEITTIEAKNPSGLDSQGQINSVYNSEQLDNEHLPDFTVGQKLFTILPLTWMSLNENGVRAAHAASGYMDQRRLHFPQTKDQNVVFWRIIARKKKASPGRQKTGRVSAENLHRSVVI